MPDSLRFLLTLIVLSGLVYLAAWMLASAPPAPREVVRELPHERFYPEKQDKGLLR
jgi:hypothetical protein